MKLSETVSCRCTGCNQRFTPSRWDKSALKYCDPCRAEKRQAREELNIGILTEGGDTYTGHYAGYNHGLDAEVKNKGDWKAAAKQKGLTPVDGW